MPLHQALGLGIDVPEPPLGVQDAEGRRHGLEEPDELGVRGLTGRAGEPAGPPVGLAHWAAPTSGRPAGGPAAGASPSTGTARPIEDTAILSIFAVAAKEARSGDRKRSLAPEGSLALTIGHGMPVDRRP